MATVFPEPALFSAILIVSLWSTGPPGSVLANRGALESCTPDELRHAYILAINRDIDAGAEDSVLRSWRMFCLSTTTTFHLHDSQEVRYWMSLQLREHASATAEAVRRTTLQRIFEVIRFREVRVKSCGPASGTAVSMAQAYSERLNVARNGAQVTKSFIDVALTVHDRMLKRPRIAAMLVQADAGIKESNPFEAISVLQAITSKGQTEPRIFWIVASMWQMCTYQVKPSRWFTVLTVRGTPETGNRGYADVALFKLESLGCLFGQLPQELGLDTQWFERNARPRLENHELYAKYGQAPPGQTQADTTWQAIQKQSVLDYIQFVQVCDC